MNHYRYRRMEYSYFSFSKSAEKIKDTWCYSAKELQNRLCEKFCGHRLIAIYVSLHGYIDSDHHSNDIVDLSCEAGGCIVVFDHAVLDLGIHAMGQFQYRIVPTEDVTIHTTKDYPPNDYNKLYSAYYDISNHDITVDYTQKTITAIDVIPTTMFCFSLSGFDEEKARQAGKRYDLPKTIVLKSESFSIHIIGDDLEYFRLRVEAKSINDRLLQQPSPFYRLCKLPSKQGEKAYVLTLLKRTEMTVEEQIDLVYQFFLNCLKAGETLKTDAKCFRIVGKDYQLVYCVEFYKKSAQKRGFVENGAVKTELLNRMGCEIAFRWLRQNHLSIEDAFVTEKLNDKAFCSIFPNPADRFIAIIKAYKAHLKALSK